MFRTVPVKVEDKDRLKELSSSRPFLGLKLASHLIIH